MLVLPAGPEPPDPLMCLQVAVSYWGPAFAGWAKQAGPFATVQGLLGAALSGLAGQGLKKKARRARLFSSPSAPDCPLSLGSASPPSPPSPAPGPKHNSAVDAQPAHSLPALAPPPLPSEHAVLSGAGRTDKGVSASGQVFSFYSWYAVDFSAAAEAMQQTAESCGMKDSVRLIGWAEVPRRFHAQYSATERRYIYLLPLRPGQLPQLSPNAHQSSPVSSTQAELPDVDCSLVHGERRGGIRGGLKVQHQCKGAWPHTSKQEGLYVAFVADGYPLSQSLQAVQGGKQSLVQKGLEGNCSASL